MNSSNLVSAPCFGVLKIQMHIHSENHCCPRQWPGHLYQLLVTGNVSKLLWKQKALKLHSVIPMNNALPYSLLCSQPATLLLDSFFFIIIICPQILLYFLVSSQNSSFVEISNKNSEAKNTNKSSYLANKQRQAKLVCSDPCAAVPSRWPYTVQLTDDCLQCDQRMAVLGADTSRSSWPRAFPGYFGAWSWHLFSNELFFITLINRDIHSYILASKIPVKPLKAEHAVEDCMQECSASVGHS